MVDISVFEVVTCATMDGMVLHFFVLSRCDVPFWVVGHKDGDHWI